MYDAAASRKHGWDRGGRSEGVPAAGGAAAAGGAGVGGAIGVASIPDVAGGVRAFGRRWIGDSILRRMAGNTLVLVGGRAFGAVLSLTTVALAVRALGIEEYGVLVLIHTFAVAVANVGKFQSWQAVLRFGAPALEEGRLRDFARLIRFTLLLDWGSAAAAAAVAVAAALLAGPALGWPPDAVPLGALYGLSVLFLVTATPTGLLRLYDRFDLLAVQSNVAATVRLLGAAAAFATEGGLGAFLAVWFAANVVACVTIYASGWREMRRRGHRVAGVGWSGLARPFGGIWRFVWSTNLSSTVNVGFVHLATLLTGALLGPTEAGLFRIARQTANALTKPAKLVVQVVYPEFARLAATGEMARLRELVLRLLKLAGGAALVCLVMLTALGPLLLQVIGGEQAQGAYAVLLWLSAAALVDLWAVPLEPALVSTGRAGTALAVRLAAIAVFVPVLLLAIDDLGLIGAGVAAVVSATVLLLGQLLATLRGPARAAR